ncbi:hypothetical protein RSOL_463640, partial [Rhizoctonia solani AG-3 Rhs1AP]
MVSFRLTALLAAATFTLCALAATGPQSRSATTLTARASPRQADEPTEESGNNGPSDSSGLFQVCQCLAASPQQEEGPTVQNYYSLRITKTVERALLPDQVLPTLIMEVAGRERLQGETHQASQILLKLMVSESVIAKVQMWVLLKVVQLAHLLATLLIEVPARERLQGETDQAHQLLLPMPQFLIVDVQLPENSRSVSSNPGGPAPKSPPSVNSRPKSPSGGDKPGPSTKPPPNHPLPRAVAGVDPTTQGKTLNSSPDPITSSSKPRVRFSKDE